ncbi:flagellar motor switch phosphatase FliY [Cohnella lubricantis]|uniref:Flagellar motor switch phosphatase FliY n=1 Tax=Cohnella lubricantis TaxID=2163172 RepID=A0A841TGZ5_9BACL|nr:flagellar motor switch phosphatase FliY [Cohnella lubricantis]MBB6679405.1 flagellar motor switch phosphatase FliY [Cohnella lubricantis]MBP2117487.1 flagellar motor switch protein FliN/FliY [Cohnella lubricantis]
MTSKDYLSQEEIDALLRQSAAADDSSPNPSGGAAVELSTDDYLSAMEQDALGEIGNITFGSAATALSTLLGRKVDITTPQVSMISRDQFANEFPMPHVAVHVHYVDGFEGINSLVIKSHDAQVIADLMLGGEGSVTEGELNEIHISAVQEAMNQMMGSSATSMSTIFNRFVNISPPDVDIMDVQSESGTSSMPPVSEFVKVSFRLKIGDLIDSRIMQLLTVPFAKELVRSLIGSAADESAAPAPAAAPSAPAQPAPAAQAPVAPPPQQAPHAAPAPAPQQPAAAMPPMGYPPYAEPAQPQTLGGAGMGRGVNVQPVQFSNFQSGTPVHADETNLGLLLDIPLKVTVELGRTKKQIKEILELSQGSIIELDKLAGEPVDILVNNKLIAKGEVVVIDENFGVRVTDIVSQWDRVQKIQ